MVAAMQRGDRLRILWVAWATIGLASPALASTAPPRTERRPVVDEYHGVEVADDYRWLEKAADPEVNEWTRRQNARTRAWLDGRPARAPLLARLRRMAESAEPAYGQLKTAAGRIFALKTQPPLEQPLLVMRSSPDSTDAERVLLDPNRLDAGGTTAIEGFFPSPDGSRIAVTLSEGGSERGTLHLYETATGRALPDRIERVTFATAGGSLAWETHGEGFYYTRYPRPGERPDEDLAFHVQVYHHRLGASEKEDTYVFGRDLPRIAEVFLAMRSDGRYLLVTVQDGDGGFFAHWLRGPDGSFRRLTRFEDGVKMIVFGPEDDLYVFTKRDAPRGRILRVPVSVTARDAWWEGAETVVPESEAVIDGYAWHGLEILPNFLVTSSALWVVDVLGGPSQVRMFPRPGGTSRVVPLLPVSAVHQLAGWEGDQVLIHNGSFLEKAGWYRYDPSRHETRPTALRPRSPVSFEDAEVVREMAVSRDGTQVPLSIIRRKDTRLNGRNPTLLTGYGGYGVNLTPEFVGSEIRLWLDHGGVLAVANLRGGGEFGEAWHRAGNLTRKQNVFDDFAACARHLVERGYTRSGRLAIEGGSNGGLLMGATLTQHPRLCRAVVSHVGIYDMLRVELDANGAFNVPEFGTVRDPEQFQALHAYSPFHRVRDGTAYPAVFFLTGDNDGRVNPAHSRKMTARLQAATSSRRPVLLRTSASSGHGQGTALSERLAQQADVLAFLFDQLGMTYRERRETR